LFAVVTAKDWAVRAGGPFDDLEIRICFVGLVAGLVVTGVAVSRFGRWSGAHLNPVVTIGLWLQGVVAPDDVAGYCVAQVIGGIVGVCAARIWGVTVGYKIVHWAVIVPSPHLSQISAAVIEAVATFLRLGVVFAALASPVFQRWTPVIAGVLLAIFIAALAQVSGAGFNPVRGLAPDVWAGSYTALWVYLAGPLLGSTAAALVVRLRSSIPLTGKLRLDPTISCRMRCALPHQPENTLDAGHRATAWCNRLDQS
jgi:aquaporin Z